MNRKDGILRQHFSLVYFVLTGWFAITAVSYGMNGDWWAYQGFVDDIKQNVKPNETVFMEDLAGRLALLSGRRFVDGDGVVNNNAYLHDYLEPGRVDNFLADRHINYFLTSNIQCPPYRKRMPWTRDVEIVDGKYRFVVDTRYATWLPIKPSVLYFSPEQLVFDKCDRGIRELLFRVQ